MLFLRVPVWIALTLVGFIGNAIMSGLAPTFALAGTVPFESVQPTRCRWCRCSC